MANQKPKPKKGKSDAKPVKPQKEMGDQPKKMVSSAVKE